MSRGSTGLVGQNTLCKAQKVCVSLWPMGWDDVQYRSKVSYHPLARRDSRLERRDSRLKR